jgi:hypothetical protein
MIMATTTSSSTTSATTSVQNPASAARVCSPKRRCSPPIAADSSRGAACGAAQHGLSDSDGAGTIPTCRHCGSARRKSAM